jgi:hypothetical protein
MTGRFGLIGRAAAALVGAALISYAPAANATTYDFIGTAADSTVVNLDITIGAQDATHDGGYFITQVTGNIGGNAVALFGNTGISPPNYDTSPNGEWYYDNILYIGGNSPTYGTYFDNPGLLLEYIASPNDEINIFSPGTGGHQYILGQSPGQQQQNLDLSFSSVTLSAATPLPSTWTMLIAGFAGLGYFAFRGSKKNSAIAAG